MRFSGSLVLDDGTHVEDVTVHPVPLEPGRPVHLAFAGIPSHRTGRVVLAPPRAAGRQVAKGGPDAARAPEPSPDPRVRSSSFRAESGRVEVEVELPVPWHPDAAVLSLELDGKTMVVQGPRTHEGVGVLALVPVARVPTHMQAPRVPAPIVVDGRLDEAHWQTAPFELLVGSLDGEPVDGFETRVQLGWDDDYLYVGARLEDDDVWSDLQNHDDPVWKQEAFEVFVFGDGDMSADDPALRRNYLELQVSPRGVTFDARFAHYRKGDEAWDSRWKTAVEVLGDLDDRDGRDEGWTLEAAIPWAEICAHTSADCPARVGQRLRINLFRLERPKAGGAVGLALSPTRVPDFHAPENAAIVELAS